jgi:hypothetical protein
MTDDSFSAAELERLRAHGIVLFADRVIFEAQPPMTAGQIAEVQAACAGPIPSALVALWQQTAGGSLDYDLTLSMNGNEEAISWNELFFHGSTGYRDLPGWIAHEQECAEEAAVEAGHAWSGRLTHLPFGGFEYLDRIYAVVEPGASHGQIVAWKQGLPPAWTHRLHEDGISPIAPDLRAAFAALHLNEDPLAPSGDYFSGQTLIEYLDERHETHGLDIALLDKLVAFYRRAMVDWRTPLANGTLRHDRALSHVALRHAIATDDAGLVAALAAAGVPFDGPLSGSAMATDVAVAARAFDAAAALVRAGAPVAPDALNNIDSAIAPELTAALLANGAEPDIAAMVKCVACGAPASARLIADACARADIDVPPAFEAGRDAMLEELAASLAKVHDPRQKFAHYLGAEGLAARIEHLQNFVL